MLNRPKYLANCIIFLRSVQSYEFWFPIRDRFCGAQTVRWDGINCLPLSAGSAAGAISKEMDPAI